MGDGTASTRKSLREVRRALKEGKREGAGRGKRPRPGGGVSGSGDSEESHRAAKNRKVPPSHKDSEIYAAHGGDELEAMADADSAKSKKRKDPPSPMERGRAVKEHRNNGSRQPSREADGGLHSGQGGHESQHYLKKEEDVRGTVNKNDKEERDMGSGSSGPNSGDPPGSDVRPNALTVIAYTPGISQRCLSFLRNISFLLPCTSQGHAYECSMNNINVFLKWSKCSSCFFFEWVQKGQNILCRMFNTVTRMRANFLLNPAFSAEIFEVKVKHVVLSFSSNFCCDKKWACAKDILTVMFGPHEEIAGAPEYLYIFTRIGDSVYLRVMKIDKIPKVGTTDALVLKEVGPYFCLKLIDIHGESDVSSPVSVSLHSQIKEMSFCSIEYYSLSSHVGSSMAHMLFFNDANHLVLLENGPDLSAFECYSFSLREFLQNEPFLKKKKIMGSKSEKEDYTFIRKVGKSIIRSLFTHLIDLFQSDKCVERPEYLTYPNILVNLKGSSVKFYGVKLVNYEQNLAKRNVLAVIQLVKGCFPKRLVPADLYSVLTYLVKNPLEQLEIARDDASLSPAKERRELQIRLHSEYMTNMKPKLISTGNAQENLNNFFMGCPYLNTWIATLEENYYLDSVGKYNMQVVSQKMMNDPLKEGIMEEGKEGGRGELQLQIMRNSDMHIPENALKDGITPFRLSCTDYIRTAYFPEYLTFMQRRMAGTG